MFLDCCDGVTQETTCERNDKCNQLGLKGACCPTPDEFGFLDCCDAFPAACIDDNCTISSTTEYLEFLAGESSVRSVSVGLLAALVPAVWMVYASLL